MSKRSLIVSVLALVSAGPFAASPAARAATMTVNPSASTFISSAHPTSSYGSAGALEVSATSLSNGGFNSLLQFNLSSAESTFNSDFGPGNWTVQSASLQFTNTNPAPNASFFNSPSASGNLDINWMQNDTWVAGSGSPMAPGNDGITWNTLSNYTAGEQSLGAFNYTAATSGTSTYPLTLASGFVSDVANGASISSMRLFAADSVMSGLFVSQSNPNLPHPVLSITAVAAPEPASWWLIVLGCGAVALLRRRVNDGSRRPVT